VRTVGAAMIVATVRTTGKIHLRGLLPPPSANWTENLNKIFTLGFVSKLGIYLKSQLKTG
ncbi:hypothetical protein ACWLQX_004835, partial [Vibrio parahaemolyticus]